MPIKEASLDLLSDELKKIILFFNTTFRTSKNL